MEGDIIMTELKTTTDCLDRAKYILSQADKIETQEDHIEIWDNKADLLKQVNEALESGAFQDEALHELRDAKTLLYLAEEKAGEQAAKTYAKRK